MCAWLCVWIGCLRCMLGVPADTCFWFFFCYSGVGGLLSASSPDQPKCCQFPWQFRWATAAAALAYLAQTVLKLQGQKESFWMQTGGAWVGTCLCKWIEDECSVLFFLSAVLYHRWGKLELAKKHYELSLNLDPEAPGTRDNYNMLRRKMDQLKQLTPWGSPLEPWPCGVFCFFVLFSISFGLMLSQ